MVAAEPTLESTLLEHSAADVARRARVLGDPTRGAIVFYRQGIGCTQCHADPAGPKLLGPVLSELRERRRTSM